MEELSQIHEEASQRVRVMALESVMGLGLKIIKDIAYHNRHKEPDYLELVKDYVAILEGMIKEDE
jgi:hypothetical protein